MTSDDEFAVWITGAVLRCAGEDIQAEVLDDLVRRAGSTGQIDAEIDAARSSSQRPGDFGAELVGAMLVPVLIEAGKLLWNVYVKKLTGRAADELAKLTVNRVKSLAYRIWTGEESTVSVSEFEALVRAAAKKQGLAPTQTDGLIAALRNPSMADALKPT